MLLLILANRRSFKLLSAELVEADELSREILY